MAGSASCGGEPGQSDQLVQGSPSSARDNRSLMAGSASCGGEPGQSDQLRDRPGLPVLSQGQVTDGRVSLLRWRAGSV